MVIREATRTDVKGIATVHVDCWRTTYKNIVPDNYLDNLTYDSREKLWMSVISKGKVFLVENDQGKIIGFANGGKERSGKYSGFAGELYAIYILKEYQGQGIGKLLLKSVVNELKKIEIYSMIALVLEENHSCKFYEALGGTIIDKMEIEISGKKLKEVVYGWTCIHNI